MNVVGIVQTDLNEFNILFDDSQQGGGGQGQGQDSGQGQQQSQGSQGDSGNEDDNLFSFLTLDSSEDQNQGRQRSGGGQGQGQGGSGQGQGQGQGLQEMTVRIKGIPEGQKATFLQMYQVIQDAKQAKDLEQNLTIVSNGDQGQQQGQLKSPRSTQGQPGQMTQRYQSNQQGSGSTH